METPLTKEELEEFNAKALALAKEKDWKVGNIARVDEEIPGDSCPKCFYKYETFEVNGFGIDEKTGELLLQGGRFDSGILATRCTQTQFNINPWQIARTDGIGSFLYKQTKRY
jgi:hypothetical protein